MKYAEREPRIKRGTAISADYLLFKLKTIPIKKTENIHGIECLKKAEEIAIHSEGFSKSYR